MHKSSKLVSVYVCLLLAGCGGEVGAPGELTGSEQISLGLAATSLTLGVGEQAQINVSVATSAKTAVYIVQYESSDERVVTTSGDGVLTAVAVGTSVIHVTATLIDTGAYDTRDIAINVATDAPPTTTPPPNFTPFLRLNIAGGATAGSPAYAADDTASKVAFSTSKTTGGAGPFPANTATEGTLLSSSRWWDIAGGQRASATVASLVNGTYALRFLVSEQVWTAAGKRAFAFDAEGTRRTESIDPFALAGSRRNVGVWVTVTGIQVSDGKLDLAWPALVDNPALHALEIAGPGFTGASGTPTVVGGTFKRPAGAAPLYGMNIGAKNYDDPVYQEQLSRLDIAILGFYPGWRGDTDGSVIRRAVQQIKTYNPAVKLGQYTVLNEMQNDPNGVNKDIVAKLTSMNWWLRNTAGAMLQWTTSYSAYETNFTEWAPKDANGDRYPQWLAKRQYNRLFKPVPEFDIWYFDNVMRQSRAPAANWRYDGVNIGGSDATIAAGFRRGMVAEWTAASAAAPGLLQSGNVDSDMSQPEWKGKLQSAFHEGLIGEGYSLENQGWSVMMKRYLETAANLKAPAISVFNIHGDPADLKQFRYAFASCRLGDGYFSYSNNAKEYSSVEWFDEYEVAFGAPVDPAGATVWSNGVYRRRFEKAMVLVNPQSDARTVTVEPGWRRLLARQDGAVNNGAAVTSLTIPPKDGIVLVRQ